MTLKSKAFIKIIGHQMIFYDHADNARAIFLSRLCWSRLGLFLTLISYLNQVACQFLIVSGFFLCQTSSLRAMELDGERRNSSPKAHAMNEKHWLTGREAENLVESTPIKDGDDKDAESLKRKFEDPPSLEDPRSQPVSKRCNFSNRLEIIKIDVNNFKEKLLSFKENSVSFSNNDIEKYERILKTSRDEFEPSLGIDDLTFNDLLLNPKNPQNVYSGNTGAEVSILFLEEGNIPIKKFKDTHAGWFCRIC